MSELEYPPALVHLVLSVNKISEIEPGFSNLPVLERLHLSNNQMKAIHKDNSEGLIHFKVLNLENNEISTIEPGAFSLLSKLESLWLTTNHLMSLPVRELKPLIALKYLYLSGNKISFEPNE